MFNLENKITWKELAPSLQSLFKTLQQQITKNANDIEDLNNRVDDLTDKLNNFINEVKDSIVPIGSIMPSQRVIPGWIKLDGSLYSRETYPDLYNYAVENNLIVDENTWYNNTSRGSNTCEHISYKGYFSYGDGSTNFRVPDLRDCFIRGTDDGRGYDVGRIHMTEQLPTLVGGCYDDNCGDNDVGHLRNSGPVWSNWSADLFDMTQYSGTRYQDVIWCRIGNETHYSYNTANNWYAAVRPRNIAYYWIMKAEFGMDLSAGQGSGGGDDTGNIDTTPGEGDIEPTDPDGSGALQNQLKNIDPIGSIKYSYIVPEGWLECNGSLLSRTEYSDLFSFANDNGLLVSESDWNNYNQGKFSYGDGSTNFRIPDFRGKFIRSLDSGSGIDNGRVLGTYQMDAMQQITGTFPGNDNDGFPAPTGAFYHSYNKSYGPHDENGSVCGIWGFDSSRVARSSNETRPKNISLRAIIKAKNIE